MWAGEAAAGVSAIPRPAHWRTIETVHFRIHFYEDERYLAERASVLAERAYASLTRYLAWQTNGRIDNPKNRCCQSRIPSRRFSTAGYSGESVP